MFHLSQKLNPKLFRKTVEQVPTRDGYGKGVVAAGKADTNVVVLTADLSESTRSHWFEQAFPDRFFEVGVAEQNMIGVAAGMGLSGKVAFAASYAAFSPGRTYDQIRVSVCYSNANVKIIGGHAGLTVGPDGATHQMMEDIAMMRALPNITVIQPADAIEAEKATIAAAKIAGPVYIRVGRDNSPVITTTTSPFRVGRAEVLKEGKDVTVIASGRLVYEALLAARDMQKSVDVEVINLHTIKPIDAKTILRSVKKTGCVVTAEEHQIQGGVGSAVAEVLAQAYPVPQEFVGMHDSFGESGTSEELLKKYGMTAADIVNAISKVLKRKG
ncbi:MAG: transketolase family protein [Candidatus Kerfeldbacteria bacterium]|nr:transketolase family protein [Candidatus Kerfeldbacteria bacterium]